MRVRTPSHGIALILTSVAAVAACGGEEAFEPQLATNERLLASAALAQLGKDDQNIERMTVVGDLDGDGIDDAVIRTTYHPDADGFATGGNVYVIYGGNLSGTIDLANVPRLSEVDGRGLGITVAAAGDVDGDGLADVLVTAARNGSCPDDDGTGDVLRTGAYLVYGNRTRLTGAVPITSVATFLRDTQPCTIVTTVAGLGDLDGDGKSDYAITRIGNGPGDRTESFVFYGRGMRFPAVVDLVASADAVSGIEWSPTGGEPGISRVGDVDGDGYDDFAVREPIQFETNVHLVRGSATRLAGQVAFDTLSPTLFLGEDLCFNLEPFAAPLGDLDGDGADDFALRGCHTKADPLPSQLSLYRIFYGRRAGFPAQVRFDAADATLTVAAFREGHVAAGDVDGDGISDLVVGDPSFEDYNGGVHVMSGDGERLSGEIEPGGYGLTYVGGPRRSSRECSDPDCLVSEWVGYDLSLGDLTGDHRLDILIEAPTNDGGPTTLGVHGSALDRAYLLVP